MVDWDAADQAIEALLVAKCQMPMDFKIGSMVFATWKEYEMLAATIKQQLPMVPPTPGRHSSFF